MDAMKNSETIQREYEDAQRENRAPSFRVFDAEEERNIISPLATYLERDERFAKLIESYSKKREIKKSPLETIEFAKEMSEKLKEERKNFENIKGGELNELFRTQSLFEENKEVLDRKMAQIRKLTKVKSEKATVGMSVKEYLGFLNQTVRSSRQLEEEVKSLVETELAELPSLVKKKTYS